MMHKMSDEQVEKWAKYYRFFYFHEDMTFDLFLTRVAQGITPKRVIVDWSKVSYQSTLVAQ